MPEKDAFAEQMTVSIRAIITLTHCVAQQLDAQRLATDLRSFQEHAKKSGAPGTLVDLYGRMADVAESRRT